jgi:P-type E1-E2 ATPase
MKFMVQKKRYEINTIVLDLNGVLSVKGVVPKGVKPRLAKLKKLGYKVILFTGDLRGTAKKLCKQLNIEYKIAHNAKEKRKEMLKIDYKKAAAIGNARIDIETLKLAKIAIATLQAEGIHTEILKYTDILVPSINDALDLFIDIDSLCATLKQ